MHTFFFTSEQGSFGLVLLTASVKARTTGNGGARTRMAVLSVDLQLRRQCFRSCRQQTVDTTARERRSVELSQSFLSKVTP